MGRILGAQGQLTRGRQRRGPGEQKIQRNRYEPRLDDARANAEALIHHVKLRRVSRSLGIAIPKAALARLGSVQSDTLTLTVAPDGVGLNLANRELVRSMATFASLNRRHRTTLRTLGG